MPPAACCERLSRSAGAGSVATRIRRLLVAIRDLHHPPRIELRKAAELARAANASIELFHCASTSLDTDNSRHAEARLQQFARLPSLRGLKVSYHGNSDYPPHEAIVRRALKIEADLVIAATHTRGIAGRLLLRNTDWELIRQCPLPLLLVKSTRAYANSVILAAVDPFHRHSKPANLDARLLDFGGAVARLFKGSLHAFHAYMPLVSLVPMPAGPAVPIGPPPEVETAHGELIVSELSRIAKSAGIPPRACHVRMGVASSELCALAKSLKASMVVMGAVSRSALKRVFIGSTAENVLDDLRCDVLILKPRGFKTSVSSRLHKAEVVAAS
jgi:universal stress protein E